MTNAQLQRLYSDRTAPTTVPTFGHRQRKVLARFGALAAHSAILDIGCATGELLKPLCMRHSVYGVDVSMEMVIRATANGYNGVDCLDVGQDELVFQRDFFNAVFCGECIEHVADTDWLLCEINRVLKPGGLFVLTFPNIRTPIGLVMMLLNLPPMFSARYRSGHVRDLTTRSMREALDNCGFRVDRMEGVDFCVGRNPVGILPGLASLLPSLSSTVVAACTKVRDVTYTTADHL